MSPIALIKIARYDLQCMFFYENSLWFWIASLGCSTYSNNFANSNKNRNRFSLEIYAPDRVDFWKQPTPKSLPYCPFKVLVRSQSQIFIYFSLYVFGEPAVHFRNFLLCCPSQRSARSQVPSVFVHLLVALLLTHSRKCSLVNCCMYNTVHLRCRGEAAEGPAGGGHVLETPVQHPPHPGAAAGGSTLYTHGGGGMPRWMST
jgi:hypothetical protein